MRYCLGVLLVFLISSCAPAMAGYKGIPVGECKTVTKRFNQFRAWEPTGKLSYIYVNLEDGGVVSLGSNEEISGQITYEICHSGMVTIISIETDKEEVK